VTGYHTMTLIEFPFGPVTCRQAPHSAALFHEDPEKAVPYVPDGRVYVVKEQVPPDRFPP
jgi:hypothetical protein